MKLKSLLYATGIVTLAVIFNARCTKINPTDIGTDLLPAVDNVTTFDTVLRVYADNYLYNDSSAAHFVYPHALGLIEDDPEFGKTDAQIYLGVVPNASQRNPFTSIDSIVGMDSVVLSLAYSGVYGDSNSVQKLNVYEISDTAFRDTLGYLISHPEFNNTGNLLGSATVNFTTIDDVKTIVVKKDTQAISNLLRIPLDPALGLRFAAYDTGNVYLAAKRDSAFQKVFNGLAIKADEGTGTRNALAYFDLSSENTKLTFYFRITKNGVTDTVSTDFVLMKGVDPTGEFVTGFNANLIKRTPAHGYANLSLNTPVTDADKLYIQSSPGSYAVLKVPGLKGIPNSIIHRAEIAFQPLPLPGNEIYTAPDLLFLDLIDSANNRFLTIKDDFVYTNGSYDYQTFGGYLKSNKFFFNITRYVQSMVTNADSNYAFRLYAPKNAQANYVFPKQLGSVIAQGRSSFAINSKIAKGRTVVGGGSNTAQPMVVRIIYSKI